MLFLNTEIIGIKIIFLLDQLGVVNEIFDLVKLGAQDGIFVAQFLEGSEIKRKSRNSLARLGKCPSKWTGNRYDRRTDLGTLPHRAENTRHDRCKQSNSERYYEKSALKQLQNESHILIP